MEPQEEKAGAGLRILALIIGLALLFGAAVMVSATDTCCFRSYAAMHYRHLLLSQLQLLNRSMPDLAPVYLFAGDDFGKIDAMLARLRARAEREGGPGALESFGTDGAPDAEALVGAIPAMSLMASRRFLLADGVERWSAAQAKPVAAALESLPPDLTIVLVAREGSPQAKAPKALVDAVAKAGGEVRRCDAPKARDLPSRLRAGRRASADSPSRPTRQRSSSSASARPRCGFRPSSTGSRSGRARGER